MPSRHSIRTVQSENWRRAPPAGADSGSIHPASLNPIPMGLRTRSPVWQAAQERCVEAALCRQAPLNELYLWRDKPAATAVRARARECTLSSAVAGSGQGRADAHLDSGCRESGCGPALQRYRSSGFRPVRFATRLTMRGASSSPSWKANTKSGQPARLSVRWEPDCLLTLHPMRSRAASTRLARVAAQEFMPR